MTCIRVDIAVVAAVVAAVVGAVVGAVVAAVVEAVVGPVRLRESLSVPPPAPLFSASSPPCVKTRPYNEAISL